MQPSAPVTRKRSASLAHALATAARSKRQVLTSRPIRSISTDDLVAVAQQDRRVAEDADAAGRARSR